jgi:putative transposase
MANRPYQMEAVVVLPDHLHCIWTLPENDADFSSRWRLIKRHFSTLVSGPVSQNGEKKIWQRRFWEHFVRDETDFYNHLNYIHYNPVRHGYVARPEDWEYSSYRRFAEKGMGMDVRDPVVMEPIKKMDFE